MNDRPAPQPPPGIHWCLGMYASASTWVFNAVMKVAAAVQPAPVQGKFATWVGDLGLLQDADSVRVVKSHEMDADGERLLGEQAQAVWISLRDPRDCVASLMRYQRQKFADALALTERSARFCLLQTRHPRAQVLRYEAGFMDDPATLDRFAAGFGSGLQASDRERLFGALRRSSIEQLIEGLESLPTVFRHDSGDILDLHTQWHRHHANRSGEIGRWRRELSTREVAAVEQQMQDWMAAFGYRAEIAPYRLQIRIRGLTSP